jgi:hypothetical protein
VDDSIDEASADVTAVLKDGRRVHVLRRTRHRLAAEPDDRRDAGGQVLGRKKIPMDWIQKIETYFLHRGVSVRLGELADVANKTVSIDGLSPAQQMLVAGFARVNLNEREIEKFTQLLAVKKGAD